MNTTKPMHFAPNLQLCVMIVFGVGVIASFLLVIAALVAAAYMLNLAMIAISELATNIVTLYNGSDSIVKLLLLCICGYTLAWLVRGAYQLFLGRASMQQARKTGGITQ